MALNYLNYPGKYINLCIPQSSSRKIDCWKEIKMPRVSHFEIEADDPERAVKFYKDVFGWEIRKWDGPIEYWLVMTGPENEPGIDGGLYKREMRLSGDGYRAYICMVDVTDIDRYAAKVEPAGGSIVMPKHPIPGVGWHVQCKDTEGNVFGMMQEDKSAGV